MNNLKKLRLLANKTQKDMAEETKIPQTTYSCYENGKTTPDANTLIKLADYFHVTIDYILGHEIPYLLDKSLLSDKQNNLINVIINLNDNQCDRVEAFIQGMNINNKK